MPDMFLNCTNYVLRVLHLLMLHLNPTGMQPYAVTPVLLHNDVVWHACNQPGFMCFKYVPEGLA